MVTEPYRQLSSDFLTNFCRQNFFKRHLQIKAVNVTETQDAEDSAGEAQLEGFGLGTRNFDGKVSFCIHLPEYTEK